MGARCINNFRLEFMFIDANYEKLRLINFETLQMQIKTQIDQFSCRNLLEPIETSWVRSRNNDLGRKLIYYGNRNMLKIGLFIPSISPFGALTHTLAMSYSENHFSMFFTLLTHKRSSTQTIYGYWTLLYEKENNRRVWLEKKLS